MEGLNRHEVPPDLRLPTSRRRPAALLSTRGAMLTIIKCAIGAGSFSLPRAFMDGGVYISFLTTLFLGLLSAYTLLLLVDSSTISSLLVETSKKKRSSLTAESGFLSFNYKPLAERSQIIELTAAEHTDLATRHCSTYPEMGAVAFPEVTFVFRRCKYNVAHLIISIGILLTSLGVCAAYVDFIAGTLPEVLRGWSQQRHIFLTRGNTPWIIMPIILGFSFLRTMKVLTYTSLFGNILVLMGCFTVIVLGVIRYHQDVRLDHNFVEWQTLPRYVGGNTFLFAIHVVILPLMQQMENQNGNKNKRDAINGSYAFITIFNGIFGAVGFLLFSSSTCINDQATAYAGPCDNILSSISGGSVLDFVKVLVSVDLLFTIPLILAASRAVIEDGILNSALIQTGRRKWLNRLRRRQNNPVSDHNVLTTGFNFRMNMTKSPISGTVTPNSNFDADSHVESNIRRTITFSNYLNTPNPSLNRNNGNMGNNGSNGNNSRSNSRNNGRNGDIEEMKDRSDGLKDDDDDDDDDYEVIEFHAEPVNPIHSSNMNKNNVANGNNSNNNMDNNIDISMFNNDNNNTNNNSIHNNDINNNNNNNNNNINNDNNDSNSNSTQSYDSNDLSTDIRMAQELLIRNERFTLFVQYVVRASLVMSVILMAVCIPGFGDMVDLVGGVVCAFTGFFLPPIIYMRLRSKLYHLHLPVDNNRTIARLTHKISSNGSHTTNKNDKNDDTVINMININGMTEINLGNVSTDSELRTGTSTPPNRPSIINDPLSSDNEHGVTYTEKEPMTNTFLLLHFLIMIFGLLTMVNTVIFTIVNINGRKAAKGQIA